MEKGQERLSDKADVKANSYRSKRGLPNERAFGFKRKRISQFVFVPKELLSWLFELGPGLFNFYLGSMLG